MSTANPGGVKGTTLSISSSRTGLTFDAAGNLWVTDSGNNRVLRFPAAVLTAGTNAPAADLAIGQANLVSSVSATSQTSLTGLATPTGVTFDSAGNMLVADQFGRVVVYPPGATFSSSATMLLGIASPAATTPINNTGVANAIAVYATAANIFVSDSGNNRVLVYPPITTLTTAPSAGSPPATAVIGQTLFTTGAPNGGNPEASSTTLNTPVDIAASPTELFVTDSKNNRVLVDFLDIRFRHRSFISANRDARHRAAGLSVPRSQSGRGQGIPPRGLHLFRLRIGHSRLQCDPASHVTLPTR